MDAICEEYLNWVMTRELDKCTFSRSETGIIIDSEPIESVINIYELNGQNVVEMRSERKNDSECIFFLHFELNDLVQGKKFYNEMATALDGQLNREIQHVLLCCTCGITTTFFSNKLNATATSLGLDYDFAAVPIDQAREDGKDFVAVLLAPQVAHQRKSLEEALPNTVIIEMPAAIFGAYDAQGALRLVVDTLADRAQENSESQLRNAKDYDKNATILSISLITRESREATITYSILDHGRVTLHGQIIKQRLTKHSLKQLVDNLKDSGWNPTDFDMIGVAGPWRIADGVAHMKDHSDQISQSIDEELVALTGTKVLSRNVGLAAATGCYVMQDEYENVAFHGQALGEAYGDEGLIFNGEPYVGTNGMAGQLRLMANNFLLSMDLLHAAWRHDGLRELVARYLAYLCCTVAPEVIYVWCDLIPDVEDLREELTKFIPEDAIPALVSVSDYESCVLTGLHALCLRELKRSDDA